MTRSRLIELSDGTSRVLVYPEQGLQLHGFTAGLPDGRRVEVIYGPAGAREPADRRYGNPILFPAVGLTHGTLPNSWDHEGRALHMPGHGWARDLYWHVEAVDARSVTGLLIPTTGMRAAYPFDLELRIRYALEGATLVLTASLLNKGDKSFPYALGFHPYLHAPLLDGGRREDCTVRLPGGVRLLSDDSWRTMTRRPEAARTVAVLDPEMPGSIVLVETGARSLEVEDRHAGLSTRVSVEGSEESYPVWVVWSAAPDAPYVCLEPWTDAPNALNRGETRRLPGGATHHYRMSISVQAL
jgi:galactose mutarotase-like enzyme